MFRISSLLATLALCSTLIAQQKAGGPFKVHTALRTESWRPHPGGPELKPNAQNEIVLWVRVQNAPDDWSKNVPLYLLMGNRRFEYESKSISSFNSFGVALHHAAFVVPKDATELVLVLGEHPKQTFRPDQRVYSAI